MTTWQKILVGLIMFGTWVGFAAAGMTPVEPLIDTIKLVGYSLGLVGIALVNPKGDKQGDKP